MTPESTLFAIFVGEKGMKRLRGRGNSAEVPRSNLIGN